MPNSLPTQTIRRGDVGVAVLAPAALAARGHDSISGKAMETPAALRKARRSMLLDAMVSARKRLMAGRESHGSIRDSSGRREKAGERHLRMAESDGMIVPAPVLDRQSPSF
jgi:hypothetical protein